MREIGDDLNVRDIGKVVQNTNRPFLYCVHNERMQNGVSIFSPAYLSILRCIFTKIAKGTATLYIPGGYNSFSVLVSLSAHSYWIC